MSPSAPPSPQPAPKPRSGPHPLSAAVQSRRISRIPAFTPVPPAHGGRYRADGWTPARQGAFIGLLAETRSVSAAAERVGMRRESAYRMRRRTGAAEFCAAWDYIMAPHEARAGLEMKVTLDRLVQRVRQGRLRPVMRRGRYVGTARLADNSALRSLLGRADRVVERAGAPRTAPGKGGAQKGGLV